MTDPLDALRAPVTTSECTRTVDPVGMNCGICAESAIEVLRQFRPFHNEVKVV